MPARAMRRGMEKTPRYMEGNTRDPRNPRVDDEKAMEEAERELSRPDAAKGGA